MPDFHAVKEVVVNASPEAVFSIVSDFSKHRELAGSGELVTVRILTQGAPPKIPGGAALSFEVELLSIVE